MLLKKICSYSPNAEFSIQEQSLISDCLVNGKPPIERVRQYLNNIGFSESSAFQTEFNVVVLTSDGETLFEIVDYH